MNINEVIAEFENNNDVNNYELWYDWFCSDKSLQNKGKKLLAKLTTINASDKFDSNNCHVFFKNSCPLYGSLYDEIKIIDDGGVLYAVSPKGRNGKAEVWGYENDFDAPLVEGTWRDVKSFFMN